MDAFVRTAVRDSSGTDHAGLLTGEDLAAWRPTEEPTIALDVFGVQVHKTGTWGQGPVLLQQLALLERLGIADAGPAERVHTVLEVAKLAFADREAWYGDPATGGLPAAALLDPRGRGGRPAPRGGGRA
jgi:gamma-glutamyltranspeptidase/glutathione hydrolase